MGFTYYVDMNVTLSLDPKLVKEVRKIAIEKDTTLTGLIRAYLQQLASEHANSARKRRQMDALEESFERFEFDSGGRKWTREELYERH